MGEVVNMPVDEGAFETGEEKKFTERCYYEATSGGGRFWLEMSGRYVQRTERQIVRAMKADGMEATQDKDGGLSEVESALLEVTDEREVDFAGPFAGWMSGLHYISGKRILVTESPELITPVAPVEDAGRLMEEIRWGGYCHGWPNLGRFLNRAFIGKIGSAEIDQLPYHLAWLQRSYRALAAGRPNRGHALIIAGDPGSGKSLYIDILTALLGGKICRPLRYIFGESNFNAEMFTAPLLVIDDEGAKTSIGDRKIVGARTKQVVAVRGASCEGKNKDSFEIETFKRLIFATNMEEQNLLVLPPIDDDLADKVHAMRFYSGEWPWPEGASEESIWSLLSQEFGAFLHWLLHEFEVPEALYSQRFGVKEFHHPEIVEGIDFLSPEVRLWGWIERTVLRSSNSYNGQALPAGVWQGSAVDLETILKDEDSGLNYKERDKVPAANPTIGKFLGKLATRPSYENRISNGQLPGGKKRFWRLLSQERADLEQQDKTEQERIEI